MKLTKSQWETPSRFTLYGRSKGPTRSLWMAVKAFGEMNVEEAARVTTLVCDQAIPVPGAKGPRVALSAADLKALEGQRPSIVI